MECLQGWEDMLRDVKKSITRWDASSRKSTHFARSGFPIFIFCFVANGRRLRSPTAMSIFCSLMRFAYAGNNAFQRETNSESVDRDFCSWKRNHGPLQMRWELP